MQFKDLKSKNFKKLKAISKSKRCHICSHKLINTGVFVWDINKKDATALKCINCLTMYSPNFEVINIGIPREIGYA
jgi:hypothetical protein